MSRQPYHIPFRLKTGLGNFLIHLPFSNFSKHPKTSTEDKFHRMGIDKSLNLRRFLVLKSSWMSRQPYHILLCEE